MKDAYKLIKKTPWKADLYNISSEEGGDIPPPFVDFLLQENGDYILQENGDRIIL